MAINNKKLFRIGKRLTKVLLTGTLLLILLLTIAWHVLRTDHDYVIQKIRETGLEKWNADVKLEGYSLEFVKPYPFVALQLRGLSFAPVNNEEHPVLKINKAQTQLNPWDLISGNFEASPFTLDSVWIHLYKDSTSRSNFDFKNENGEKEASEPPDSLNINFSKLPPIQINYLDFYHQNNHRKKWQRAELSQLSIQAKQNEDQKWYARLWSDCYFEGLVFNEKEGGFLMNTYGKLDLNIAYSNPGQTIALMPSSLVIDQNRYALEGQFKRADPNQLQLEISNEGVTIQEVLPLLSHKINTALHRIKIDRPIRAKFSLNEALVRSKKGVIQVDFETDDAKIQFKEVLMTSATLSGYYSNDCDEDGIGNLANSCVTIHQLDGDISDVLPAKLKGVITDLRDPDVEASGIMNIDLPRLNALLEPKDKFTFTAGNALVNFQYKGQLINVLDSPFDEQNIQLTGDAVFDKITLETDIPNAPTPSLSGHMSFDENNTMVDDINLGWMGSNIQISGKLSNLPEFLFYDEQALRSDVSLHFDQLNLNNFTDTTTSDINTEPSQSLDFIRLERLSKRLASNFNGTVDLAIDKLIYDTLFLTDLKTQLRLFSPHYASFVDSSMIRMDQLSASFMGLSPFYLDVDLTRDSITNVLVNIRLPKAAYSANFFLSALGKFKHGDADLELSAQIPLRSLRQSKSWLPDLRYNGRIVFYQTALEVKKFTWPIGKIKGTMSFDNDQLLFDNLQFNYERSPFVLDGKINNYPSFKKDQQGKASIDLRMYGSHLDLRNNETRRQKSEKEKAAPSLSPTQLFRDLDTVFQLATGKIDLRIDSVLTIDHVVIPFALQAQLITDDLDKENHQLKIDSFNFGFDKANHVSGSALINKPDNPQISARLKARMNFAQLGKLLPSQYLEMKDGYFKMDLDYQSPLYDTLNAENYLLGANLNGTAEIVNGNIFYNYRDFEFDNIYGHFRFDQKALYIRDLDLKVNNNRLIADGLSSDFFPFFVLPDRRVYFDLNVASPRFDFGGFTAPYGLGKDTLLAVVEADSTLGMLSKTGSFIDQLLDKGSIDMQTDFKELVYHEFAANNLTGNISLQTDTVRLSKLQMEVAKGTFSIDGSISDVAFHQPKMQIAVQLKQNDTREIFRQFEDFGQDKLSYKNMEGQASADINFKADINSNYSILPETMYGDMYVKLSGGQLIDVDALKKVSGFLFRKRQLDHILIDTLETFTHIRGSDLYIDRFYLHSSSFDFRVEGIYSLRENNKTRILFAVPVSNLFRRHLTQKELNSGNSKRKGMRVFIEARPKKDRMRFFLKVPVFGRKKYRLKEGGKG